MLPRGAMAIPGATFVEYAHTSTTRQIAGLEDPEHNPSFDGRPGLATGRENGVAVATSMNADRGLAPNDAPTCTESESDPVTVQHKSEETPLSTIGKCTPIGGYSATDQPVH